MCCKMLVRCTRSVDRATRPLPCALHNAHAKHQLTLHAQHTDTPHEREATRAGVQSHQARRVADLIINWKVKPKIVCGLGDGRQKRNRRPATHAGITHAVVRWVDESETHSECTHSLKVSTSRYHHARIEARIADRCPVGVLHPSPIVCIYVVI